MIRSFQHVHGGRADVRAHCHGPAIVRTGPGGGCSLRVLFTRATLGIARSLRQQRVRLSQPVLCPAAKAESLNVHHSDSPI